MLKSFINKIFFTGNKVEAKNNSSNNSLEKGLAKKLNKHNGISFFKEKRFDEAHKIFKKLNNENPTSENKYLLSLSNLMKGEPEIAIKLFEQAINIFEVDANNIPHSIPNMKTYFADQLIEEGYYTLAFKLLEDISNVYCKYKILDDTFLFMRGVPFFANYIEVLDKIKDEIDKTEFENLISKLEIELGKDGKFYIDYIIRKVKF
ncbi:MAG: tetratricopeptide repeat protein [Saprospiraceae bacterium]